MKQTAKAIEMRTKFENEVLALIPKYVPEVALPDSVTHYTTAEGLAGIIQTGELWASRIDCTNDPLELKYVFDAFEKKLLRASVSRARFTDPLLDGLRTGGDADAYKHSMFMVSFSREDDDLSQFRGYASDGHGFSLVFDPVRLVETINSLNNEFGSEPGDFKWRKVSYDKVQLDALLDEVIKLLVDAFNWLQTEKEEVQGVARGLGMNCSRVLGEIAGTYKQEGYKGEQEYRLVNYHPDLVRGILPLKFLDRIKCRFSCGIPCPYLPLPLRQGTHPSTNLHGNSWIPQMGLKEIVIGPKNDFERGKDGLNFLLCPGDAKREVQLRKSSTAYR